MKEQEKNKDGTRKDQGGIKGRPRKEVEMMFL